jgi:hypothetical protein
VIRRATHPWFGGASPCDRRSSDEFSARPTIDITPALRGRITVAALRRGLTVAEMPWALLAPEEFVSRALLAWIVNQGIETALIDRKGKTPVI